ncbi:MAG: hypothetical protein IIC12_07425 [Proteobacteria bacterium]|nr:hypothetical protein [Pseudomonadota bacterium]
MKNQRMNTLVLLYLVLATSGLVVTLLTFIQTWEHRRYHRSRQRHTTLRSERPQVTLIVPCKGIDLELDRNLRAFFCQDSAAYEICFVVEV